MYKYIFESMNLAKYACLQETAFKMHLKCTIYEFLIMNILTNETRRDAVPIRSVSVPATVSARK